MFNHAILKDIRHRFIISSEKIVDANDKALPLVQFHVKKYILLTFDIGSFYKYRNTDFGGGKGCSGLTTVFV